MANKGRFKNKYIVKNGYAIIYIERRNGDIYETIVDLEDLERLKENSRNVQIYFNNNNTVYAKVIYKNKVTTMQRFIMDYDGDLIVDHINNNALDNRKQNLRIISQKENSRNKKYISNTEIRGITQCDDKFIVKKWFNGLLLQKECLNFNEAKDVMKNIDLMINLFINYSETK